MSKRKKQPERVRIGIDRPYQLSDGVTQSMLTSWLACRVRARYMVEGYRSIRPREALNFGSLFHGLLQDAYEAIRAGKSVPKFSKIVETVVSREAPALRNAENYEALLVKAAVLYNEYFKHWADDYKRDWVMIEKNFNVELVNGYRLRGKRDGAYTVGKKKPKPWLLETKTTSAVIEEALDLGLPLDFQLLFYILATEAETGVKMGGALYNVVVKPGQNYTGSFRNKPESLNEYADRVRAAVQADPAKYFRRYEVTFSAKAKAAFRRELATILDEYAAWFNGDAPEYRGFGACYTKWACEYLPVCSSGGDLAGYDKEPLFSELGG